MDVKRINKEIEKNKLNTHSDFEKFTWDPVKLEMVFQNTKYRIIIYFNKYYPFRVFNSKIELMQYKLKDIQIIKKVLPISLQIIQNINTYIPINIQDIKYFFYINNNAKMFKFITKFEKEWKPSGTFIQFIKTILPEINIITNNYCDIH